MSLFCLRALYKQQQKKGKKRIKEGGRQEGMGYRGVVYLTLYKTAKKCFKVLFYMPTSNG